MFECFEHKWVEKIWNGKTKAKEGHSQSNFSCIPIVIFMKERACISFECGKGECNGEIHQAVEGNHNQIGVPDCGCLSYDLTFLAQEDEDKCEGGEGEEAG